MDNLFEILLPLIFFAIYFASQFFGKKGEEEQEQQEPESMRKVREELRRKIEERRRATQEGQQQQRTEEPQAQERAGGAVLRESRPRPERPPAQRDPERRSAPVPEQPAVPSFPSAPDYDSDLEQQMAEVRRSQEKVEAARRQARERIGGLAANGKGSANRSPHGAESYRQFLRSSLRDPKNLRKSFLLHEVFGTPVGMREEGKMRPSWDL